MDELADCNKQANATLFLKLGTRIPNYRAFPGGAVKRIHLQGRRLEGDVGLIPGSRRSPGGGNGKTFQYSCLGNPMDRGAWWATVREVS